MFSSENFSCRVLVKRGPGERHSPSCYVSASKWAITIHAWGLIGWDGVGPLRAIQGTLTAHRYITEMISELPDNLYLRCLEQPLIANFQQDNAPPQRAAITRQFLAENGVRLLDWPWNSPDMNPIDNVWAHVARRVSAHGRPSNREELWGGSSRSGTRPPCKSSARSFAPCLAASLNSTQFEEKCPATR